MKLTKTFHLESPKNKKTGSIKERLHLCHLEKNGRYHLEHQQWDQAEEVYSNLVGLDDIYWAQLGQSLQGQDRYQEAKECYEYALGKMSLDSDLAYDIFKGLSVCYLFTNDNDAAEEFLNKARVLKRQVFDLDLSLVQGVLLINKTQYQEAEQNFQNILQKDIECVEAWAYIAETRAHLGDLELSYFSLQKALDLNPANKVALKVKVRLSVLFEKNKMISNNFYFRT